MNAKDIKLFYEDLSEVIVELYHVDETVAKTAIQISNMDNIIKQIGSFIYHDPIESWAESVWSCYKRKSNEYSLV